MLPLVLTAGRPVLIPRSNATALPRVSCAPGK